jgi:hypothetical protein
MYDGTTDIIALTEISLVRSHLDEELLNIASY